MEESKVSYLVKYALSGKGIETLNVKPVGDNYVKDYVKYPWSLFTVGRDVFYSRQEAVNAVLGMKAKRIASLKKQIAKLEKLVIT